MSVGVTITRMGNGFTTVYLPPNDVAFTGGGLLYREDQVDLVLKHVKKFLVDGDFPVGEENWMKEGSNEADTGE